MQLLTRVDDAPSPFAKPQEFDDCYPRGRRCQHPNCTTFLSIWNPGPYCWCCYPKHRTELQEAA